MYPCILQGGAYLTLLNTIANMGIIFPKAPLYYLVDMLTYTSCLPPQDGSATDTALLQVCVQMCENACVCACVSSMQICSSCLLEHTQN